jgi:Ni,Fe-hydrogenase III large subunit
MSSLSKLVEDGRRVEGHQPWPRAVISAERWCHCRDRLAEGHWSLLALWGESAMVHMSLLDNESGHIAVVSLECPDGKFPSVGLCHAPAIRPERALRDLFGLEPTGAVDRRPWLDHGTWGLRHPLGAEPGATGEQTPYEFLTAEGQSLHQIPVGPVHAGIIEPGHFRFTAGGETVVRLEQRLGYTHKGVESLMAGASVDQAARFAGRISGDSTVAFALAFAMAVESALGACVPRRAVLLRALMAELERLANHLGDIGAICNDAAFSIMHAHCGMLREQVLRGAGVAFGHRLMMDRVVPGGVSVDMTQGGDQHLRALVGLLRERFPQLIALYDGTTSLQDRTIDTGVLSAALARQFAAGGYVGRASGREFDARRAPGYAPYGELVFKVPVRDAGDVDARVWIRIDEVEQSLTLVEQLLDKLEAGPVHERLAVMAPGSQAEGAALVEGFRGDVLAWVRLDQNGQVARCHMRDPSWFQWPLLEAAIEGNIVADFPLCNKSFNCSYSGHDL